MTKIRLIATALILAVALSLLLALPGMAAAEGSCGDSITYTVTAEGSLVLSGSGSISDFTPSTIPWSDEAPIITSVVIPEGITVIGIDAFLNLYATEITVPESVILIGAHALGYSYGTEYLPLENFTVKGKAGSAAEEYATANGFTFVPFEDPSPTGSCGTDASWILSSDGTLTVSGTGAIDDFANSAAAPWSAYYVETDGFRIEKVVVSEGITAIGNHAFDSCRRLTSVTLPSTLTRIGSAAFLGCSDLTAISLPDSLSSIGTEAFSLSGLTEISLPSSVTELAEKTFYGCSSLKSVTADGVKTVGSKAFESCGSLSSVSLASVTVIGNSAFEGCHALSSFTFPNSLTAIGNRAFYGCSSLLDLRVTDAVTRIGEYAFAGCTDLVSVALGNGITVLEEAVFFGCSSLSTVSLGEKLTEIGELAFADCTSLTSLLLPKSLRSIAPYAVGYTYDETSGQYAKIASLKIHAYLPSIANRYATENGIAFSSLGLIDQDGGSLTGAITWSINTETGVFMLSGSGMMPDFATFGDTPWSLYRDYIKAVVVNGGLTNIGACAFESCDKLVTLSVAPTVAKIGDYAFAHTGIEVLILPPALLTIGDSAFEGCKALRSVSLPAAIDAIGQAAFRAPNALTSLYIPASLTYIGANAIGVTEGNAAIHDFVIRGTADSIAENYAQMNGITFQVDGFVDVSDPESGASATVVGDSSDDLTLSYTKSEDPVNSFLLLAGNEYALIYDLILKKGEEIATIDGSATIRIPIPENVNSLAVTVYHYDSAGVFTAVDATVENGFFLFTHNAFGRFIITNADLSRIYTVTVEHKYETDGASAVEPSVFFATAGASHSFKALSLEGFQADRSSVTAKVTDGNVTVTFTYRSTAVVDTTEGETTPPPAVTEPVHSENDPDRTWLIVIEILLILALVAAIVALVILNQKKKKEEDEKEQIAESVTRRRVKTDKFSDTIVVPDAPTREIDIQSLFADEPEEEIQEPVRKPRSRQKTGNRRR